MSNITLYSEEKLVNNTNFVNNFLDQMLNQYCDKRYTSGVALTSFQAPSLNEVILDYYPEYYFKAPGLLADKNSTNVMIVYEPHLHDTLQQSLEHKLSRLFIYANSEVNLLRLFKKGMKNSGFSRSVVDVERVFPLFDNSAKLIEHLRQVTKYNFRFQEIESLALRPKVALTTNPRAAVLIYKPDANYALQLQAYNKEQNEKLIEDIWFFKLEYAQREGFNQELAYTIHCNTNFNLSSFFTPEFCIRLQGMAEEIMNHLQERALTLSLQLIQKQNEKDAHDRERLQKFQEAERLRQEEAVKALQLKNEMSAKKEAHRRNSLADEMRAVVSSASLDKVVNSITPEMVNANRDKIHELNSKESAYTNHQSILIVIVLLIALFIVGMLFLAK